ncbi:Restriction alleviation protein Lar [compost metagenome]
MTGINLKPCPCCGSTAAFNNDGEGANWIECTKATCGLSTMQAYSLMDSCLPLLAEAWNSRTAPAAAQHAEKCQWTSDSGFVWHSSCGVAWSFHEGGPVENGMLFCHSCGKPLEEVPNQVAADEFEDLAAPAPSSPEGQSTEGAEVQP